MKETKRGAVKKSGGSKTVKAVSPNAKQSVSNKKPAAAKPGVSEGNSQVASPNINQPLWAGRLAEKPEAQAFAFQSSINVDKRLVFDDIAGSRAHAAMLGRQGIIPKDSAAKIERELERIESEIKSGKLEIDVTAEDIHSFLESALTERLGDSGKMVHAGRSRNDQVAVDFRLYLKREIPLLQTELAAAANVLLDTAQLHVTSIMPGYTHLQRAQPITLAFHLTAWCAALERDLSRFSDALCRLDECPLGSGALDRKSVV